MQISIPSENRWSQYINLIDKWEYESLEESFNDKTQYFIFGARSEMEDAQLRLFPNFKNIHTVIFRNGDFGHEVVKNLKESGDLYKVIEGCFSLIPPYDILKSAGKGARYCIEQHE